LRKKELKAKTPVDDKREKRKTPRTDKGGEASSTGTKTPRRSTSRNGAAFG